MQARFNIERERNVNIFTKSYKNDRCLFQFHSQIEIYFVDEGEMDMLVDGKQEKLTAPAISVALSYATHAYKTPEHSSSSVLLLPAYICEEFMLITKGKRLLCPFIKDPDVYARLKECYAHIKESSDKRIKQLGYIYMLLGIILDCTTLVARESEMDTELASRMLFYIDENFKNGITPISVAQHFGYSQSYISRYFSSTFGTTLSRYLTSVKLRNAIMLMHEGKHGITYCALESGFASMRTFYRAFHNEFGTSPKDMIREHSVTK